MTERGDGKQPGNAVTAAISQRFGVGGSRDLGTGRFVTAAVDKIRHPRSPVVVRQAQPARQETPQPPKAEDTAGWRLFGEKTASVDKVITALTGREMPHVDEGMLTSLTDIAEKRRSKHEDHRAKAVVAARIDMDKLAAAEATVLNHTGAEGAHEAVYRATVASLRVAVDEGNKEPDEEAGADVYEKAFARQKAAPTESKDADEAVVTLSEITDLLAEPGNETIASFIPPAEMRAVAQDASTQARDEAAEHRAERVEAQRHSSGLKAKTLRQAIEVVSPHATEDNPGARQALAYLEEQLDLRIEELGDPDLARARREEFAEPLREGPLRHLKRIPREVTRKTNPDNTIESTIRYDGAVGDTVIVTVNHSPGQKMKNIVNVRLTKVEQGIVISPIGKVDNLQISVGGRATVIIDPGEIDSLTVNRFGQSGGNTLIQDTHIGSLTTDAPVKVLKGHIGEATVLESGVLTVQQGDISRLTIMDGEAHMLEGEIANGVVTDSGLLEMQDGDALSVTATKNAEVTVNGKIGKPHVDESSDLTTQE